MRVHTKVTVVTLFRSQLLISSMCLKLIKLLITIHIILSMNDYHNKSNITVESPTVKRI